MEILRQCTLKRVIEIVKEVHMLESPKLCGYFGIVVVWVCLEFKCIFKGVIFWDESPFWSLSAMLTLILLPGKGFHETWMELFCTKF